MDSWLCLYPNVLVLPSLTWYAGLGQHAYGAILKVVKSATNQHQSCNQLSEFASELVSQR